MPGIRFGNTSGNVSAASDALLNGDKSLKLSGQSIASANTSGVFQGITVSPGDHLQASASALVRSAESLAGTSNLAQMKIEYYSQYGGAYGSASFLGETQTTLADSSTANDTWLTRQLTGIVPAGATEARLVLQFLQPSGQAGAVHVDDVSFGIVDAVPLAGDYNHDGIVDPTDYDVWKNNFGSTANLDADGNNNGVVDAADYVGLERQCRRDARGRGGRSSWQTFPNRAAWRLRSARLWARWVFRSVAFRESAIQRGPTEMSPTMHQTNTAAFDKSIKVTMKYIRTISRLFILRLLLLLATRSSFAGRRGNRLSDGQGHRSPPRQNGGAYLDRHAAAFRKGRRHLR